MGDVVLASLLLPLAGAVAAAVAPARRTVAVVTATGQTVLAVVLAVTVLRSGPVATAPGGWEPPLGIALRVDGVAAAVGLLAAVVVTAVLAHACASPASTGPATEPAAGRSAYWPLTLLTLAGLQAVLVAADLFTTYVALELLTLGAVALVALGGRGAYGPALRYLCLAVLGSFAFLVAVALVYARTGTLTLDLAAAALPPGPALTTALGLATVGLLIKSAVFPLHAWLPDAHAAAPTAVSPLLSALVVKGSFVVLLRVWTALGGDAALASVLAVLATGAVSWGGVMALRAAALKRVVAYSTVAQVGYLVLLLPLVTPALAGGDGVAVDVARTAWQGVLLVLLAHGLAKAAMFLAAGTLVGVAGSGRVADLGGTAARAPVVVTAYALAGVCLAGLPPSLGFVGKWALLDAALTGGRWWVVAVLLGGGLLTAAATARVLAATLREPGTGDGPPPGTPHGREETPAATALPTPRAGERWPALTLALLAVVTCVGSAWLADLVLVGAPPGVGG